MILYGYGLPFSVPVGFGVAGEPDSPVIGRFRNERECDMFG